MCYPQAHRLHPSMQRSENRKWQGIYAGVAAKSIRLMEMRQEKGLVARGKGLNLRKGYKDSRRQTTDGGGPKEIYRDFGFHGGSDVCF